MHHLYMEDGSINPSLLEKEIIIWGAGNDGLKLYSKIKELDGDVCFFVDSNKCLHARGVFGIPVFPYQRLDEYEGYNLALAFHQYPEVLEKIPKKMRENVFADYLFEHKGSGTCMICGHHDFAHDRAHFAPFLKERMFLGQDKATRLLHCLRCGMYYSEYRPNAAEMEHHYVNYRDEAYDLQRRKYEPDYSSEKYYGEEIIEQRKRGVEDFIAPYVEGKEIKNCLDYGGDRGQFIPEAFSGANKYVYDISQNETIPGVTLLCSMGEAEKTEWSIILCMMLLEHVSDPMDIMRQLAHVMPESGFLYIEVPYQNYMLQYSDVEINEHINFFREPTMAVMGEMLRLKILRMETDDRGCIRVLYRK